MTNYHELLPQEIKSNQIKASFVDSCCAIEDAFTNIYDYSFNDSQLILKLCRKTMLLCIVVWSKWSNHATKVQELVTTRNKKLLLKNEMILHMSA